ncbi:hypothetical protein, partial [Enterobacter intestinihominis]
PALYQTDTGQKIKNPTTFPFFFLLRQCLKPTKTNNTHTRTSIAVTRISLSYKQLNLPTKLFEC